MSQVYLLEEKPVKKRLQEVFRQLIERHESFRTSFQVVGGQPVQEVYKQVPFSLEYYRGGTGQENETIIRDFIRPFDLSRAPLLRGGLLENKESPSILIVDMHHSISDATSFQVLAREFATLYAGEKLPPLRLQYKDYSQWWKRPEQQQTLRKQERYWLKQFEDKIPALDLPTDFERPARQSFDGGMVEFAISEQDCAALRKLSKDSGTTMFIVLLAFFNIFLARLSGQEDIVVGTPVVGRRHADLRKIIGMFVNTLALRNHPRGNKKFSDFLREVKEQTLEAFENQDYPFDELVERLKVQGNIGQNPLFTAMLSLHNIEAWETGFNIPGLKLKPYRFENHRVKFDLVLTVFDTPGDLSFVMKYGRKIFKEETVKRFSGYFVNIISTLVSNDETRLKDIAIAREFMEVDTRVNREEYSDFGF